MTDKVCYMFWVCSADDYLIVGAVTQLLRVHPGAQVLVMVDKQIRSTISDQLVKLGCTLVTLGSTKLLEVGETFVWDRWQAALDYSDADWFIRLDPDTDVHKPLVFPKVDWFGPLYTEWYGTGTWGCVSGHSRQILERWLSGPKLGCQLSYRGTEIGADGVTQFYMNKLGVKPVNWDGTLAEAQFTYRHLGDWMATHPCLEKRIKYHLPARVVMGPGLRQDAREGLLKVLSEVDYRRPVVQAFVDHLEYRGVARNDLWVDWAGYFWFCGKQIGHLKDGFWECWTAPATIRYRKWLMAAGHNRGLLS